LHFCDSNKASDWKSTSIRKIGGEFKIDWEGIYNVKPAAPQTTSSVIQRRITDERRERAKREETRKKRTFSWCLGRPRSLKIQFSAFRRRVHSSALGVRTATRERGSTAHGIAVYDIRTTVRANAGHASRRLLISVRGLRAPTISANMRTSSCSEHLICLGLKSRVVLWFRLRRVACVILLQILSAHSTHGTVSLRCPRCRLDRR